MEKISNIVRGNARVASTDLKNSSAVRPGAPSYGRPVGESPEISEKFGTTAQRAVAAANELAEHKRSGNSPDQASQQMADSFFMNRIRRPSEEELGPVAAPKGKGSSGKVTASDVEVDSTDELMLGDSRNAEVAQPVGFKPRGTYVDYRA